MKFPLSFYKLVMAAAVALPTMALATITPEAPQQDTDNCYMIGSAAELYGFAEMVNGTGGGFNGCGKLTADIVVNKNVLGTDNANVNADGEYVGADSASFDKWAPINGFAGKFHGQGHTISGLYFNDPEKENVGLFGSVGDVEIDGLGLVDSYFEGRFFVGGFIGYAESVNVYIRDSYNSSVMRGHSDGAWQGGVGGFVGALNVCNLEIENSYNSGFVTGERDAGGFVGYIWGDFNNYVIFNSYNRGSVISAEPGCAGGFVGTASDEWAWLYVYNSYNAGKVNGGEGFALMSGGFGPEGVDNFYYLEGSAKGWGEFYGEKESTPAADFADGTVAEALHGYSGTAENGTAIDGSVWGQGLGRDALPTLTGAIGPALTLHVYGEVKVDSTYTPGTALPTPTREGFAFLGWYADAGFSGSAVTNIPSDATGALEYFAKWIKFVDNCYEIASAAELYSFAEIANGMRGGFSGCGKLTADIVVNENVLTSATGTSNVNAETGEYTGTEPARIWTPIGTEGSGTSGKPFKGRFYGNGHTISGLYVYPQKQNNSTYKGLFGYVEGNVVIDGVGIVDSYISGFNYVGGLVGGLGNGAVLTISKSYNAGFVGGNSGIGGLVGGEFPSVASLQNPSAVKINNSYNLGRVKGSNNVGGLVGQVVVGDISNSYNAGLVSSVSNPIVGSCLSMTITNSYYLGAAAQGNYGTNKTAEEFANGSVAKALHDWCEKETGSDECKEGGLDGSVWGQDVLNGDPLPNFSDKITGTLHDLVLHTFEGDSRVYPTKYLEETGFVLPTDLTREGYVFLGWYKTSDFSGSAVTEIPANATGKLEYYAKWIKFVDNCYEIASADDLFSFAARVNGGDGEICGKLTDNITVNENVLTSDGALNVNLVDDFTPWTPIGTSSAPFKGTFYGQGHTISGLYYAGGWQATYANAGLFGYVEGKVVIDGVGIVDSYFYANNSVGALVGNVGGSSTDGSSLTISNSYNAGRVSAQVKYVGGLVGVVSSSVVINNSYNVGPVNGKNLGGGLVGSLLESATASINNSYNSGSLTGSEKTSDDLVYVNTTGTATITNCFFTGKSQFEGNGATKKTAEEFVNGSVVKALHDWCEMDGDNCKVGGLDGTVWGQDLSKENSRPEFIERLDYKMGGMTFFELAGKIDSAYVDATSDLAVDFPEDVVVSGPIKFKRTFAGSGYSTIVLPFLPNCSEGDCIKNGENVKFYEFGSYANATVSVTEVSPNALQANTPYLVKAAGAAELVFGKGGTFNTTEGGVFNSKTGEYKKVLDDGDGNVNGWTIYGTYTYKKWNAGDAGIGSTYGFAANDGVNDPAIVGEFKKVGAGAYIYPMRAYLEYVEPSVTPAPRSMDSARRFATPGMTTELPEEIRVVVAGAEAVNENPADAGTMKVIGTINTRTGEFKFESDRWFDLNGRYLGNKKPTQKGAYYNNGKKVIVK